MIIKEFAKLCDCNPQTLRYYDNINLLKPVKVDYITGYRHYSAEQALDYYKIKKLQDASFSIEEIRALLNSSDEEIYNALENKIQEQKAKLNEIINIQKSYHKELKEMKEKIELFKEKLMQASMELDYKKEFGITKEKFYEVLNSLNELADSSLSNEDVDVSIELDLDKQDECVVTDDFILVYDINNFNVVKDALNNIKKLTNGEYYIHINHNEKYKGNLAFTGVFAQIFCEKYIDMENVKLDFYFDFEYPSKEKFLKIYKRK